MRHVDRGRDEGGRTRLDPRGGWSSTDERGRQHLLHRAAGMVLFFKATFASLVVSIILGTVGGFVWLMLRAY